MEISSVNQDGNEKQIIDNIQKFIDRAVNDVIYVRIGKMIPRDTRNELIEVFRNLKQQIIWEYDTISSDLPTNVMICQSIPTKIILSHKNTALFITQDDSIAIKQALHYGVPMLLIPIHNNELHSIVKSTALENMSTMRITEIKKGPLIQKLNIMLDNKDLKAHAKEIASLLHHNSVNLSSDFVKGSSKYEKQPRELSQNHVHLDALGALFFVIFIVVKLSLKFCRFYNSWEWKTNVASKKTQ